MSTAGWFMQRLWTAIMLAAVAGAFGAAVLPIAIHYFGVPTVTTCVAECPVNTSPVDPGRPLPDSITDQYGQVK